MPLTPIRLADEQTPPTLLFVPPGDHDGVPLILFGHGAHLSKDDPIMQMIAKGFCRGVGRGGRGDGLRPVTASAAPRERPTTSSTPTSRAGCRIPRITRSSTADWRAVEAAARAAEPRITGPTGYAGFSMGAMFGLSIVADLPSVDGGGVRARRADERRRRATS